MNERTAANRSEPGEIYTYHEDGVAEVAVDVAELLLLGEGLLLLLLRGVVRGEEEAAVLGLGGRHHSGSTVLGRPTTWSGRKLCVV